MSAPDADNTHTPEPPAGLAPVSSAPFFRAPEAIRTVFIVTFAAACGPLLAGVVLFGWRALVVAFISVASCALIEWGYYRVTRTPALLGRSHAYLTGLLLALTLPAFAPWYVPLIGAAFAIIVGKAVFGGVGHFLWQPALVGWLAVAVMFPDAINPPKWNLLARGRLLIGDVTIARPERYYGWMDQDPPPDADAFAVEHPATILLKLTNAEEPQFSALAYRYARGDTSSRKSEDPPRDARGDSYRPKPAALMAMPRINELLFGARAGAIGETCIIVIIVAGLYLAYRHYVKWQLPLSFILSAAVVVAIAPVQLASAREQAPAVWFPIAAEGFDVGFVYVCYQLLSGELMLAAFFLATEMTCRPTTPGGQLIFGVGCGVIAMGLQMFMGVQFACFLAILVMNTLTPTIDALWRPKVLGRRHFLRNLLGKKRR